jgi:mannose-6-phosphate isomerase-like protein (cupin superfamily)
MNMNGVEHCRFNDELFAIIVRATFREPGITFFSSPELSQQLAYMSHPAGKSIAPHRHNKVTREVHYTQEVLVIQKGKLQVDFYTEAEQYLESRVLLAGDVILLCSGAHGFQVLEPLEMIEIKQGPYAGENDKTRFPEVPASIKRIGGHAS